MPYARVRARATIYIASWCLAFIAFAPLVAQTPPDITVLTITSTLDGSTIGLANAGDGSGRLFSVAQDGLIEIWDSTQVLAQPFLNIGTLVSGGSEQGLLGLAFHPDYANNGFFYVNYTNTSGDTVIVRYSVSAGNPNVADAGSGTTILTFAQTAANHNGGDLHFGPDGYLYISSGDGGANSCDAQDDSNLLGKMLRIDVDGDDFPADPNTNYAIPATNPLVGVAGAAVPGHSSCRPRAGCILEHLRRRRSGFRCHRFRRR